MKVNGKAKGVSGQTTLTANNVQRAYINHDGYQMRRIETFAQINLNTLVSLGASRKLGKRMRRSTHSVKPGANRV